MVAFGVHIVIVLILSCWGNVMVDATPTEVVM